ncbi:ABC transporter ATP-binding protein [Flavobacterium sp. 5]|uniref:ABC transporter ATP-binding protein n=1 Tax=Flavobacterium sp. 5 TaxID=2035199 RepID=UPI000C2C861E|nr:ABC transporter ATP-binding protein [Flavobacterium sp. 5]PKB17447.1 lipopolysaccharide transport system ATP-binding protein [Flavobacterium sp. 5]
MGEVLIKVDHVSKKFAKGLKKSLLYGLSDVFSGIIRRKQDKSLRKDEFWAVSNISFEVRRGECLGLIGHNGAGKSTLLKILNGLIAPDEGSVTMYGKVGALIELGAGFNPILTGRENIYNNAAIIGFSKQEIKDKFDAIVAFAEIEEFIDMPVQNYSSGMKVRLGFAIAAQMEPDVLIIDEVLAVGDLGFILKCFKRIDTILPNTAIVFVSHAMPMVSRICNQIVLMDKGESEFQGKEVGKGIDFYYSRFLDNESNIAFDDGTFEMLEAKGLNINNNEKGIAQIKWGEPLKLYFKIRQNREIEMPIFIIVIYDKEQREVAYIDHSNQNELFFKDGLIEFEMLLEKIQLSKGFYTLDISINKKQTREPYLRIKKVLIIQVLHESEIFPSFLLDCSFKNSYNN